MEAESNCCLGLEGLTGLELHETERIHLPADPYKHLPSYVWCSAPPSLPWTASPPSQAFHCAPQNNLSCPSQLPKLPMLFLVPHRPL